LLNLCKVDGDLALRVLAAVTLKRRRAVAVVDRKVAAVRDVGIAVFAARPLLEIRFLLR
jgi:hypothetical protein